MLHQATSSQVRYRDQVEAALAENRKVGYDRIARTGAHRSLAAAVNELLERYLKDPTSIQPGEVLALELGVRTAGRWCEQTDGVDRWAAVRARRLELLRNIRAVTVANSASAGKKFPANTSDVSSPNRRGRQIGGFLGDVPVQGSPPKMSMTRDRQNTPADAARRARRERKTFAVRIRIAREERRWTQDQMGDYLGVRAKEINRYEHAHTWGRPPSEPTRIKFALKLGKPRDWFVPEVETDDRLERLTADEEASLPPRGPDA